MGSGLDFDAGGDPKTEYERWRREYLRLEGESTASRQTWNDAELARKNAMYFLEKSRGGNPKPPDQGIRYPKQGKKQKPKWPGWGEKIKQLAGE
jgi:hypothetical protein